MKLIIKNLTLENFKGIKHLSLSFNGVTRITGCNASGKSTIADAFTWLLFGKDMFDRKDFEVKTLVNGVAIPRINHTVTGIFLINDAEVKLQRTLKEKWVKQRGKSIEEYQGNETEYTINDVPKSQKEFQEYINSVIPESTFKLITVPTYFNTVLKWQERRAMLTAIASVPNDDTIAGQELSGLLKMMREQNKTLIDLKKEYARKKLELKKRLDEIPGRIDECRKAMPENKDFQSIQLQIKQLEKEIEDIDTAIQDRSKTMQGLIEQRSKALQVKSDIELKISSITSKARVEFSETSGRKNIEIANYKNQIQKLKNDIEVYQTMIADRKSRIQSLTNKNSELRETWKVVNAEEFHIDEHALICPTCKQDLPEGDQKTIRQNLIQNFQNSKNERLLKINEEGKNNKATIEVSEQANTEDEVKIEGCKHAIADIEIAIDELEKTPSGLISVEAMLSSNVEYQALNKQLSELIIPEINVDVDNSDLMSKRHELRLKIDSLKLALNDKIIIESQTKRLNELLADEKIYNEQLAEMEGIEMQCDQFTKKKMDAVEESVNSLFPSVRFRMYEQQINGGESETCVCLINGVPYSDANKAAQINAGIEIINVFSNLQKAVAPIWVDNAEAINEIAKSNGQLIALEVSDGKLNVA